MAEKSKFKIKDLAVKEKRQWVRITRLCNNNCLFCLDKENQNGKIVPWKEVRIELKEGRKKCATRAILSGGEPTLHPQIFRIIKEAKKIGYRHVQIISNGRMLAYKNFTKKLKAAGLDEVTISLHSHLKKQMEEITQVKGSYEQAMRGLLNALKYKLIISVDIVINKINYKNLKDTLNFFIRLGVFEFDLLWLIPFGNAWENRKKLFFSSQKAKNYLDEVFSLEEKNPDLFLWTNRLPATYLEGHEQLIQNPIKLKDEVRGMELELKNYIRNKKLMFCFGERCQYCFMQGFCRDLFELKNKKILKSKTNSVCLKNKNNKEKSFKFNMKFDIYQFLDFYIKHRYFVKSLRCQKCKFNSECDGGQIDIIRNEGFKILIPQK